MARGCSIGVAVGKDDVPTLPRVSATHTNIMLQAIGAMNEEQALSPLGYHLAKLPVPPKVLAVVGGEFLMWLLH